MGTALETHRLRYAAKLHERRQIEDAWLRGASVEQRELDRASQWRVTEFPVWNWGEFDYRVNNGPPVMVQIRFESRVEAEAFVREVDHDCVVLEGRE
jgi:hypothetical protein